MFETMTKMHFYELNLSWVAQRAVQKSSNHLPDYKLPVYFPVVVLKVNARDHMPNTKNINERLSIFGILEYQILLILFFRAAFDPIFDSANCQFLFEFDIGSREPMSMDARTRTFNAYP